MKREGKSQDRKVCSGTVEMVTEQTKPTVDVQALHGTKQKRFSRHKFYSWSTMDTKSDRSHIQRKGRHMYTKCSWSDIYKLTLCLGSISGTSQFKPAYTQLLQMAGNPERLF